MMKITKNQFLLSLIYTLFLFQFSNGSKTTEIKGRLRLPNDLPLNTTLITLNNGEYNTYTKPDGSFTFYNVKPGVHLLDVQSTDYMFSHVKIQLLESKDDSTSTSDVLDMKCIQYPYVGSPKQAIPHPLILTAHATYNYFQPKPGFSFMSLLKNPMMLMMLFSVFLMFLMPTMMENLDPEQKEQMQRQMEMQSDPQKMLSQLLGDFTGGDTKSSGGDIKSSGGGRSGGKNSRRTKRD